MTTSNLLEKSPTETQYQWLVKIIEVLRPEFLLDHGDVDCITWPFQQTGPHRYKGKGYGIVTYKDTTLRVHIEALKLSKGLPSGMWTLHKCDNPPCFHPAHLYAGTRHDNIRDAMERNRHSHGSILGTSKLTEAQVWEIKNVWAPKALSLAEIAKRFNVHAETIGRIRRGQQWTHVEGPVILRGHTLQPRDPIAGHYISMPEVERSGE